MAFQEVLFTAEAVVQWVSNLELCTMTFYGFKIGGYTQSDIDDLATAMDAWAVTNLKANLSSQQTYNAVSVRGLESIIDLQAFVNTGAGAGGAGGAPYPNNLVMAAARTTGFTGRSARGRVFWPTIVGALDANENFIATGFGAAVIDALNEVRVEMLAAGWVEVVVSRQNAGVIRPAGEVFPVVDYQWRTTRVARMSRRLPGI